MQNKNQGRVVSQNTGEKFLERAGGQLYKHVMRTKGLRKEI